MICYFIDHLSDSKNEHGLAELSLSHKIQRALDDKNSMSLLTCHRIEYYINEDDIESKTLENLFRNFKKISDQTEIYLRLFNIALGLESQIIGENSIYKQASQCIQAYLYNHPQEKIWMNILLNAKKTRDKFQFWSKNHGQLIYDHIKKGKAKTIIFFGAGLLNQSIIDSINLETDYKKVILVTKDSGKAKKHLASSEVPIDIIEIAKLNKNQLTEPYDMVIATDRLNDVTKNTIADLCAMRECLNVADISSSPVSEVEKIAQNYFSMYSKNTRKLVKESNLQIEAKKNELLNYLNSKHKNWYIY